MMMQRLIFRRLLPRNLSRHNLTRHMACRPKAKPLYVIRHAYPSEYPRVVRFMMETFLRSEPSLVNIGLSPAGPPSPSLVRMMELHVSEGLSLLALDREGCIAGAAVNLSSRAGDAQSLNEMLAAAGTDGDDRCAGGDPRARQILEFYAYVSRQANLWQVYCVDDVFECAHLAVHPKHQGQGIGRRLVAESWVLARDLAYRLFRIDATSKYTARIAEIYAWKCIYSLPYRRYFAEGDFVFKCVQEPHTEVKVFVDRLDWYCGYYPPTRKQLDY